MLYRLQKVPMYYGKCDTTYKYHVATMFFGIFYYGKCQITYKKVPLYYHKSDATYKNTMVLLRFLGYSTMANVRSHTKRCHCTTIKVMPLTKIPWCYYVFLGTWYYMVNIRSLTKKYQNTTVTVVLNTGLPQGCVLSPILFSSYLN